MPRAGDTYRGDPARSQECAKRSADFRAVRAVRRRMPKSPNAGWVSHIKVEVNIRRPVRQESSIEVRDDGTADVRASQAGTLGRAGARGPPAVTVIVCFLPPGPHAVTPGRRAGNAEPETASPARCSPGRLAAADRKWRRGTSRPVRHGRLQGAGAAQAEFRCGSPEMPHKGGTSCL